MWSEISDIGKIQEKDFIVVCQPEIRNFPRRTPALYVVVLCVSFVVNMPAVHSRPYQPPDRMLGGHIDNCWLWYVLNRQHRWAIERLGLEPFVYVTNVYEWGKYKIGQGQNPIWLLLISGWIVLFTCALWHSVLRLQGANNTRISFTYRCWGWSFDVPGAIDLCPGHRVELGVDLVPEMGIQVFRVEDGFIVAVPPCRHQRHTHMELTWPWRCCPGPPVLRRTALPSSGATSSTTSRKRYTSTVPHPHGNGSLGQVGRVGRCTRSWRGAPWFSPGVAPVTNRKRLRA